MASELDATSPEIETLLKVNFDIYHLHKAFYLIHTHLYILLG